ncbi:pyridoxal phosphate-dependent aminotransferase [Aquisalibacillus elongatus]|uniref:Aminotransferase n=1 Tax=Aquisalibacillus elongatus TaxID=485577 RepID=A0A3N5CAT4_9BACI|nr:pyridoxal phosphate-dependent aminotransferase [Aquisalibacillus elongatus]RPF55795.1 L-aspartate aminotransferase [Aquisalibacillus elongatus]
MSLAKRVQSLTPSSTLAITSKAKALKADGHDVIGLGAGEPDFNTPKYILEAAKTAMDEGKTKYTPAGGLVELKDAIIEKFKHDQNLDFNRDEVIVTTGAKHALYTLFQVLLNKDDEVIIPIPYWVSYPEQVKLSEGVPVYIKAQESNQFKITPEQLEASITDRTKAFVINSPSNPTGVLYSEEELRALGEVAVKHNIWIVSDEIYEKLIYGGKQHQSIAASTKEIKDKTIIINGVSKSHSMTGWRIGYAAGNSEVIKAMSNLVSHATSNPTSIAQHAAIAAYTHGEEEIERMNKAFEERLHKLYNWIVEIPNVTCVKPDGAFYLFPNVKQVVENSPFKTTDEWVAKLLEEEKVALVPGSGFGAEDNIRLSYANSLDQLEEAAKRIKKFVETHTK